MEIDDIFKKKRGEKRSKEVKEKSEQSQKQASVIKKDKKSHVPKANKKQVEVVHHVSKPITPCNPIKAKKSEIDDFEKDLIQSRIDKKKRKTIEGVSVFSFEELNIGAGEGDTPQCPFDCNCCF